MRPASLGVDIDSVCGGRGLCGRCQVTQSVGHFPKHGIESTADHLPPWALARRSIASERRSRADRRLSCAVEIAGDVLIDVPPESQVHSQVVRKGLTVRDFEIDPVVRLYYVEVERPTLETARRRPRQAPGGAPSRVGARRPATPTSTSSARSSRRSSAATTRSPSRSTTGAPSARVWPGLHERALGVAIDVGSTTIAGHLADLVDGRGPRRRTA